MVEVDGDNAAGPTTAHSAHPAGRKTEPRSEQYFSAVIGLLIAIVTILGAWVGWRSAVAGDVAGNADDAGILAALNAQEVNTLSGITSNQHRSNYLSYWLNKDLLDRIANDGSLENIPAGQESAIVRDVTLAADLATASKRFFPAQYLNADGSYDIQREQAENVAEAAQKKNLDPDQQFAQANIARAKSLALVAVLIILGVALWLLAAAEIIEHRVKYALGVGGLLYLLIGAGTALAVEGDAPLADVSGIASVLCYVAAAIVLIGLGLLLFARRAGAAAPAEEDSESPLQRRLKQSAAMLIVTVALLGAVVAYLQADAGNNADATIRRSQLEAAEALGLQATGEAQVNFQYGGAAQSWEDLRVQAIASGEAGDSKAAARYTGLQEDLTNLSEMLRPPYFDASTDAAPNVAAYQSDQYVARAATLSESSDLNGALNNAWNDKSNTYIIHLTLLAAALALLGLSLTFSGIIRPLFVGVGLAIVALTLVWVGVTYFRSVPVVAQAAVDAYGRGVGASYRGDAGAAVTAFDEALRNAPGYPTALYARGGANYSLGNYDAAALDYEAAKAAGKDDASVAWELGLTYYLLGRFDAAVNSYNHALDIDPRRVWVRLDLAIAKLAQGKMPEAQTEYSKARDEIAAQVVTAKAAGKAAPPSLLFYLDAGADDLESLVSQLGASQKPKPGAPSKDKISDPAAVEKFANEQFTALKSLAVSLEYNGKPVTSTVTAVVDSFEFGVLNASNDFDKADTFPSETKDISIIYDYDGMRDGQQVLWKVYVDGDEYPEYRTILTWDKGATGAASQPLTDDFAYGSTYSFDPGEYTVEMYIDAQLVQRGYFTVQPAVP